MTMLAFFKDGLMLAEAPIRKGQSVMEVATRNGVTQIKAECGGAMACATCHVHLAPEAHIHFEEQDGSETDMLEMGADYDPALSRLSCQLLLTGAPARIEIALPREA